LPAGAVFGAAMGNVWVNVNLACGITGLFALVSVAYRGMEKKRTNG